MKVDLSKTNKVVIQKKDGTIETYLEPGIMIETVGKGSQAQTKIVIKQL